jgi:aminopeptidase N
MDEGFNTFINELSTEAFNNGEYYRKKSIARMSGLFFNDNTEPVMSGPDNMKEGSIGILAYMKPGLGLYVLRESILGPEKFDKAFRTYIERWAFKHPTPWDFFHTMENVSGEELNWFWRGWFFNKWKVDQAVKGVKYVDGNFAKGANITVENIGQLPMPTTVQAKFKDGSTQIVKIPVEVWKRNKTWTFRVNSTKEIETVTIDPENKIPDSDLKNNTWKSSEQTTAAAEKVNLQDYVGVYGSKQLPIKITFKVENNKLVGQVQNQKSIEFDYDGNDKFVYEAAGLELQFSKDKKTMTLSQSGQTFDFTKE